MIKLTTLPRNGLAVIKAINIECGSNLKVSDKIIIGNKIKIRNIEQSEIIVDTFIDGNRERLVLTLQEGLHILVQPF